MSDIAIKRLSKSDIYLIETALDITDGSSEVTREPAAAS